MPRARLSTKEKVWVMSSSDNSRRRKEGLRKANSLTDVSILGIEGALPVSELRVDGPYYVPGREKESVEIAFQALLANARRELARLFRDVNSARQTRKGWNPNGLRSSDLLVRAVRCAATQYMLQTELGNLALKDDLTGLHNRRGFYALAERQLKVACRSGRGMFLFFIDVDGLKDINDSLGHAEGDRALKRTAGILKKTFRDSDILARLGGDEFAVLAIEASGHSEATILARLQRYLGAANAKETGRCISVSVGVARFDHGNPASIAELMAQADQAMYQQKWSRMNSRPIPVPRRFSLCETTSRSPEKERAPARVFLPSRAARRDQA
jgi:diguanylate cyclase (GGDEF)-like protein